MKTFRPFQRPSKFRVVTALLVSLVILVTPVVPLAASPARYAVGFSPASAPLAPAATVVTATKTDSWDDSATPDGKAEPGQTITYDVNVANTGAVDATGVAFTDTIDPNTTLVPGSLRVSPLAFADSYNATINTPLSIPAASGVLANDTGTPAPTAQAASGATSQGGSFTLSADGSFTYNPPNATFQGADTFTYTATNGTTPNDTATVTINVDAGPAVTTTSPTGGATSVAQNTNITINFTEPVNVSASSFKIECPAPGNLQAFSFSGSGTNAVTLDPTADLPAGTTCTVTVVASQVTDVDAFDPPDQMAADYTFSFGVKPDATDDMHAVTGNVRIDTAGSGYSVLTNDNAPGATISAFDATSAQGGQVTMNTSTGTFTYDPPRGYTGTDSFTYTVSNGAGSDTGTVVLTVTDMIWFVNNGSGACSSGCDGRLSHPYATLAAFEAVNGVSPSTNPEAGDNLFIYTGGSNYTGPLTLENNQKVIGQGAPASIATITGIALAPDSDPLPATGGTAPVITGGGITLAQNDQIHGLNLTGTTTTAIKNTVTAPVGAFLLNTVSIDNTSTNQAGITLTDGGTAEATGVNNINAGQATALNVTNTNIGAAGLTFKKITSVGGTVPGIILNGTGSAAGLTVTGDGGGANNGSGGTISGKTGPGDGTNGVSLSNTTDVSLGYMNINNNSANGVFATAVNGIRFNRCNITSNADQTAPNESNLRLINITGTGSAGAHPTSLTNSLVANGYEHDIEINHSAGTLTEFLIANSSITNNGASGQAATRVLIIVTGGAAGLTVQDSTVSGNRTPGALTGTGIQGTASAGLLNVKVYRNLLQNNFAGVDVSTSTTGVLNFDVTDNGGSGGTANNGASNGRITGSDGVGVSVFTNANATGSVNGFIRGNTIGTQGVAGSGSLNGRGIQLQNEGSINATVLISGNIVQSVAGSQEINIQHGISVAGAAGTTNATVINNTLRDNTSSSRPLNSEILNSGTLCSDIQGNVFSNNIGQGGGSSLLRVNRSATGAPTHRVRQLQATAAANANELDDANGLSFAAGQVTQAGALTFNGGACTLPAALAMSSPVEQQGGDQLARVWSDIPAGHESAAADASGDSGQTLRGARIVRSSYERPANRRATRSGGEGVKPSAIAIDKPAVNASRARALFSGETVNANVGTLPSGKTVHITFQVTVNNSFTGSQVSNQGTVSGDNFTTVQTDDPAAGGSADPTVTPILTPPSISVKDATVAEPASGSTPAAFAVTLSHSYTHVVTVDYTTASGGANPATAGSDYTTTSGTLTFNPGQTVQTVSVPVLADGDTSETDETFLVNLSNATGGSTIADGSGLGTIKPESTPGTVLISELRTSGPAGPGDDFVEVYNNSDSPITVAASDASAGWALVTSGATCGDTPVVVGVIPNGTVIPARGNYLFVGPQYGLNGYATGDQSLSANLAADGNVGLFNTSDLSNISTAARLDAVGFGSNTGGNCDLLREGATVTGAAGSADDHSFVRSVDKGVTKDTNDNASDFILVSTDGAVINGVQSTLGAPGPENLSGARGPVPCNVTSTPKFGRDRLDSAVALGAAPNTVRSAAVVPNGANGTIDFRRRFTNNTGGAVTQLRFRITNTLNPATTAGAADLRALGSSTIVVSTSGGPATVVGTTLEQPPTQLSGGGVNSSLGVGTVTLGTPLASGASVNLHLLFGVQTVGKYHLSLVVETTTAGQIGQDEWELRGNTEDGGASASEGGCNTPPVANAGADQTIECGGGTTAVTLDGTASTDADGDALTYEWREGATVLGTTATLNTSLSFGSHTITLKVTDPSGDFNEDTVVVNIVDTTDPMITAPANKTVSTGPGASSCGVVISDADLGSATASDGCSASVTVTRTGVPSGNNFPVGTTIITYTADDGHGHTKKAYQSVTVIDNTPPTVTPPANIVVNAPPNSCSVSLDPGTASANDNCAGVTVTGTRSDALALNAPYPVGTTTITWKATDASNNVTNATQTVTVKDVTPPTITLTTNAITLGPPNHQYVTLSVSQLVASASDSCDPSVNINKVVISQATSDEVENGNGDGNTLNDIVIAPDCKSLQLRAEREGGGDGRVYKITLKVKDSSGNVATAVRTITVPKGSGPAVDSGVHYTVNGCNP